MQLLPIKAIWLFGMVQIGCMMLVLMRDECVSTRYEYPPHYIWIANISVLVFTDVSIF